jgi:hypothetical protein
MLTFISCKPEGKENGVVQKDIPQINEINKEKIKTKGKTNLEILPMKKEMIEYEIANSYFVSDTVTRDFNNLIGITEKWSNIYPIMFPATYEGELSGVFDLDDSTKLIPFFIDGDMEIEIFTKWKIINDSTLTYTGRLKPNLDSKYSFSTVLQKVNIEGMEYFIGDTGGGEGGEMWQSLWTAKYNGQDDFIKIDQYETGYEDEENSKSISYELKGNKLSIILNIDSMVYNSDTIIEIPISKILVKEVELK